jgi:hypothetical protein
MNPPSLFDEIRTIDEDAIRAAHRRALALGLETTRLDAQSDCHALMCMSIEHLMNAALISESLQVQAAIIGDPASRLLVTLLRRLRDSSAAATLLLSRALEVHSRDTGRDPDGWREEALSGVAVELSRSDRGVGRVSAAEVSRSAMLEVSSALLRSAHAPVVVPRHLATAIGRTTAIFLLAGELLARVFEQAPAASAPRGWDGLIPAGTWPHLMVALTPPERAELHGVLLGLAPGARRRVVDELLSQIEWMSFGAAMLVAIFRAGRRPIASPR